MNKLVFFGRKTHLRLFAFISGPKFSLCSLRLRAFALQSLKYINVDNTLKYGIIGWHQAPI
jgi:hypothetical protein